MPVKARGQHCGAGSSFPPFCGLKGFKLRLANFHGKYYYSLSHLAKPSFEWEEKNQSTTLMSVSRVNFYIFMYYVLFTII